MTPHPWIRSYPPPLRWDAPLPVHPLFSLLDEAESRYGSHTAIDFLGRRTTYRELSALTRRMARGLQELGVGRGVQVGLFLPNCPQFVISYYAILRAGGTVVNYNPLYSPEDLRHQICDSQTEIMVTLRLKALYPKLEPCLGTTPLNTLIVSDLQDYLPLAKRLAFTALRRAELIDIPEDARHVRFGSLLEKPETPARPVTVHPDGDVAVVQYTGGTTGTPKGAVLTHANLYANTLQCGLWFTGLTPGKEVIVGALPLFHVFAMATVMNLAIHTGSAMLLHPRFDMKAVLSDIQAKRATLMPGVPTMFAAILHARDLAKYDLTSLKMCISGGGPLPQEVKMRFEAAAGCTLVEGYGLTESSPVACANPLFGLNKPGTIGLPFPGTLLEIRDPEPPHALLPDGEIGEVCITGPQVMRGYLHRLEDTRNVLKNGRLHTGDLGTRDADGYFTLVDRIKEMIISGGYKIYPRHIEEVLYRHGSVAEAAVIGVPHAQRGQVPKLFLALKTGAIWPEDDVRAYLRGHVPAYAVPAQIAYAEALPKSPIGKILKKALLAEEARKS